MIKPKKSLGQNFLKDKNIIKKIINLTNISNEKIIEIGPGLGALTNEIISLKQKKLILIEKDQNLYELMKSKFKDNKNVSIVNEDILDFNFNKLSIFKIISNLPYNISTKFLLKILSMNSNFKEIICMIQKEVSIKFNYSEKKMNKFKFLTQYCGIYEIKFDVSKNVFFPKPKVKSSIIKFKHHKKKINTQKLMYFIDNFFIHKRKKIISNKIIKKNKTFKDYGNLRYEELNYQEILDIYERFNFSLS